MNFDKPVLTIDLDIIKQNYLSMSSLLFGNSKIASVVKADAYGLGAEKVAPLLFNAGCRDFMVSNIEEAILLRQYLANEDNNQSAKIYVLNGIFLSTKELFLQHDIIPVINHLEQLKIWQEVKSHNDAPKKTVLHLDTGMNRLGMEEHDFAKICSKTFNLSNLDIIMLMSHLSSSDEIDNPVNKDQLDKFLHLSSMLQNSQSKIKRSIANSGGVFLGKEYHLDMTRVGAALFGLHTGHRAKEYVKNPVKLTAPIIQIQNVRKGEKIGYNGTYLAAGDMRIATIPVGYADGIHRVISNKGKVYINNMETKIIGTISMDLTIVDVTRIPENNLAQGCEVEIIGLNQTPDQLARDANSIGYEIITSLGNRYKRVYT